MNILLVLTGGTICTSVRDGLRTLDTESASLRLVEAFRNSGSVFAESTRFTVGERFHTLSENMTVAVWNRMADYFRTVDFTQFDGVIVAHGTDTLAYTASMFALLLTGVGVPIVFVSSNAPLEHGDARANGAANFRAAVECVGGGIPPGVYVTYRNVADRRMYLHRACHLKQCGDYSEDFHSAGAVDITETLSGISGAAEAKTPLLYALDEPLTDCVLHIHPYVGIRYDAYDVEKFRAVLHGTYHSGTACISDGHAPNSILYLLNRCADAGTELYLSPARNQGEVYDTVPAMLNHVHNGKRIIPLYGTTAETAYCKLLLWHSCQRVREGCPDFLTCNFCGEAIQ